MEVCHLQQVESNHPPITESYREAVLPNIFLAAFVLFHHSVHFSLFLGARQNRTSFSVVSACQLHVRLGDRTNLYRIGWGTRPLWCFGSTSCARKTKTEAYARVWSAWRQKRKCMLELVLRGRRKRKCALELALRGRRNESVLYNMLCVVDEDGSVLLNTVFVVDENERVR